MLDATAVYANAEALVTKPGLYLLIRSVASAQSAYFSELLGEVMKRFPEDGGSPYGRARARRDRGLHRTSREKNGSDRISGAFRGINRVLKHCHRNKKIYVFSKVSVRLL